MAVWTFDKTGTKAAITSEVTGDANIPADLKTAINTLIAEQTTDGVHVRAYGETASRYGMDVLPVDLQP